LTLTSVLFTLIRAAVSLNKFTPAAEQPHRQNAGRTGPMWNRAN
jgi:hypothetical protein